MAKYDPTARFREQRIYCPTKPGLNYYLRDNEYVIFATYFDNYDVSPLATIIRENQDITDDFREFITDVFSGKHPRPFRKKTTTTTRDFKIYLQIHALRLADPTLPLRSNKKRRGAADIVADQFYGTNEEVALKAHQKIQRYSRAWIRS